MKSWTANNKTWVPVEGVYCIDCACLEVWEVHHEERDLKDYNVCLECGCIFDFHWIRHSDTALVQEHREIIKQLRSVEYPEARCYVCGEQPVNHFNTDIRSDATVMVCDEHKEE